MQDPYANIEYLFLDNSTKQYTEEGNVKWDIPEITVNDGEYFYLQLHRCMLKYIKNGSSLQKNKIVLMELANNYNSMNENGFPVMTILREPHHNNPHGGSMNNSDDNPIIKISKSINNLTFQFDLPVEKPSLAISGKTHKLGEKNHSGRTAIFGIDFEMILKIIF